MRFSGVLVASKVFVTRFITSTSGDGSVLEDIGWGLGGSLLACLSTQLLVVFFRATLWSMRLEESGPLRKRLMDLTIVGDDATITARGGRSFAPQLDPLVPSLTECRYLPEILWLYRLPVCISALKIVRWFRDRLGVTCSWLICVSRRSRLGMTGRASLHVELSPFVSCVQTCDHGHSVASLYCTSFDF